MYMHIFSVQKIGFYGSGFETEGLGTRVRLLSCRAKPGDVSLYVLSPSCDVGRDNELCTSPCAAGRLQKQGQSWVIEPNFAAQSNIWGCVQTWRRQTTQRGWSCL